MKISSSHLKKIIHEELFYREFHRKTEELTEEKEGMMDQPTFDAKVKWVMKNQGKDEESARKIVGAAVRDAENH